ncbi:C6 transcription factor [Cordyceps militaris]|uniref:C6 transcription factor n=1 Tax=Cordyceps militaris TaxID=73501 RepID=A0A2H4SWI4_CORMI|nr:C6 transcription factor [Cordyceps militaris]
MAAPYRLREQLPPPKHPDDGLPTSTTSLSAHRVFLRHPSYPEHSSTLLVLAALDPQKTENSIHYGLHHETARIACAIVANCRWDGFLSESNARDATPLALAPDDLLLGRNYYFHVPACDSDTGPYPIVPSFQHFIFPHNNLPPTWNTPELELQSSLRLRDTVHTRDKSCRITASVLGNEVAHLIPQKEDAWFAANHMHLYAMRAEVSSLNATNDTSNALLLRSDLHQAFDNRQLILVPKWGAWAIHVLLGHPGEELAAVYHNVLPQALSGLAIEYLFARFAWTVLGQTAFVRTGVARRLVLVGEDGRSYASDVSGKECRDSFMPALARGKSKSRSHGAKKRTHDELVEDEWGDLSDSTDGDICDLDWGIRGRARKRLSHASNSVLVLSSAASSFGSSRDTPKEDDVSEVPSEEKHQPPTMAIRPSPSQEISFLSPESLSTLDDSSKNPRFIELRGGLRGVLLTRTSGENALTTDDAPDPSGEAAEDDTLQPEPKRGFDYGRVSIPKIKLIHYLKNWIIECAPYLDKLDRARHFATRVPVMAARSPALLIELYQESIRLLAPGMRAHDANMLVTACILAVMELMSGSPRNWRRHIEGCATLFDLFQVNDFSGGVLQAMFWCYARMEVCGVIISGGAESTALVLRSWAPPASGALVAEADEDLFVRSAFARSSLENSDMHANWAVYLCAKACDLLYRSTRATERREPGQQDSSPFAVQWRALWKDLESRFQSRPDSSLPTLVSEDSGQTFPTILYAHWPAISSNQVYHATCLIMLDMRPQHESVPLPEGSAAWHARRVCGISVTNPHRASLINAIQPLYLAGRLLTHTAEHIAVGRLFKMIEETTGWGALWPLRDLEIIWGYMPSEILPAMG